MCPSDIWSLLPIRLHSLPAVLSRRAASTVLNVSFSSWAFSLLTKTNGEYLKNEDILHITESCIMNQSGRNN